MVFEVGKCYLHTSGITICILGKVNTIKWGKNALFGEMSLNGGVPELTVVGPDTIVAYGYEEIDFSEYKTINRITTNKKEFEDIIASNAPFNLKE